MALIAMDGFDHYAYTDSQKKGWSEVFTSAMSPGRFSTGQGANWNPFAQSATSRYPLLATSANKVFVGFGWQYLSTVAEAPVLSFLDGGTAQCLLTWDGSARLLRLRAGGTLTGAVLATSAALGITVANWHHLFVTLTLGAAGAINVAVDLADAQLIATGINTQASSAPQITHIGLPGANGVGGNVVMRYDDLYVMDTSGTINNSAEGDLRIGLRSPTADGTTQTMTPSSAGTHFDKVNLPLLQTTTFVYSNTVGQEDTYKVGTLGTGIVIKGVQLCLAVAKDDAAGRSIAPVIRTGSADVVGPDFPLSASIQIAKQIAQVDPNTSAAWTVPAFNTAEFGQKVTV